MNAITRLIQAAYLAKDTIDRIHDQTSLSTAGHALIHFVDILVETPAPIQRRAADEDPSVPVLEGLTREYLRAVYRVGSGAEEIRVQVLEATALDHVS